MVDFAVGGEGDVVDGGDPGGDHGVGELGAEPVADVGDELVGAGEGLVGEWCGCWLWWGQSEWWVVGGSGDDVVASAAGRLSCQLISTWLGVCAQSVSGSTVSGLGSEAMRVSTGVVSSALWMAVVALTQVVSRDEGTPRTPMGWVRVARWWWRVSGVRVSAVQSSQCWS